MTWYVWCNMNMSTTNIFPFLLLKLSYFNVFFGICNTKNYKTGMTAVKYGGDEYYNMSNWPELIIIHFCRCKKYLRSITISL